MDLITKDKRSEIMSRIKGKDTKIEIEVRKWLFHHGTRYRKNSTKIIGRPDVSIKKYRIAIFINGCFWHSHECVKGRTPKTNTDFWVRKFERNIERDTQITHALISNGWMVIIIWECQLRKKNFENTMHEVLSEIIKKKNEVSN